MPTVNIRQNLGSSIREAIEGHLDVLVETSQVIPDPEVLVDYIDVPIPVLKNVN